MQDYCKDDLRALTKYITWDLEERGNEALAEAIGGGGREAVEVYNLAIEESINGRKSKPTPTINAATQVQKRTKKRKVRNCEEEAKRRAKRRARSQNYATRRFSPRGLHRFHRFSFLTWLATLIAEKPLLLLLNPQTGHP